MTRAKAPGIFATFVAASAMYALPTVLVETRASPARGDHEVFVEAFLTGGAATDPTVNRFHNGHWELTGMTLRDLIVAAFAFEGVVSGSQILDGSEWMMTTRYRVHAEMHPSAAARPNALALRSVMLQRFLADRFTLAVRRNMTELPVYDLIRVDAGPLPARLVPVACVRRAAIGFDASPQGLRCPASRFAGGAIAHDVSMAELAAAPSAAPEVGRIVRDRTALAGRFDLQLHWAGAALGGSGTEGVKLTTETLGGGVQLAAALQSQLGLRLAEARDRVSVVQIVRAERPGLD